MCGSPLSSKDLTTNIYSKDNKYLLSMDSVLGRHREYSGVQDCACPQGACNTKHMGLNNSMKTENHVQGQGEDKYATSRSIEVTGLNFKFDSGFPDSQNIKGNIFLSEKERCLSSGRNKVEY